MEVGTRISHFELQTVIGRGGMGEVWRAHDTRLGRDVALKTLPAEFAADAGRVARLAREAQLLATLNHPGIAAIHGLEEQAGRHWLVLELVEGQTLDERLERGRIPVDEAIGIAMQVAGALEAAHARGIIHRDLKASNIRLAHDGRVRILDFGIARALETPAHALVMQTTITGSGEIAGTPAYMSPEQARGKTVGPTADIWAFGILLYQMLTGELPFKGSTAADTIAAVLQASPDWSLLPGDAPDAVARILRHCLEKDPQQRLQHAGDIRILLEDALSAPPSAATPARSTARTAVIASLALATLIAAGIAVWMAMHRQDLQFAARPIRSELIFGRDPGPSPGYERRRIAISRDGSRIALEASGVLSIRSLDAVRTTTLDFDCPDPFFSPDGAWIGCAANQPGLVKIPAIGGRPVFIAEMTARPSGAVWNSDGSILFTTSEGLFRVHESGGEPELILKPDETRGERLYAWPAMLPDGRSLLLTVLSKEANAPPRLVHIYLVTRKYRTLLDGATAAHFVSGGYLLFAATGGLRAVRFDPAAAAIIGESVPIPDVELDIMGDNSAASYAVADNGTLIFLPRRPPLGGRELYWRDLKGVETPIAAPVVLYNYPQISPDGRRIALDIRIDNNRDVYVLDIGRGSLARVTSDAAEDNMPKWSPDGRRVFFSSNRGGNFDVYSQAADGSDAARRELAAPGTQIVNDVSPDGEQVLVNEDFRRLSLIDLRKGLLRPLLKDGAAFWLGVISPDGRWLAYESSESGNQMEIFLRPFPAMAGRREKVSLAGGRYPVWGPRGSGALYYLQPDGIMMRADLQLSPELRLGAVTPVFKWTTGSPGISGQLFDVSPVDGRFLLTRFIAQAAQPESLLRVTMVLNSLGMLQRLFPE